MADLASLDPLLTKLSSLLDTLKTKLESAGGVDTQVVELWKGVGTSYSGLWAFYVAGASAVLGYAFSEKFDKISLLAKHTLLALFAIFALANLVSVVQNLCVYNAATRHLRTALQAQQATVSIGDSISITPVWVAFLLHVAVDVCVLAILWVRAKAPDTDHPKPQAVEATG